MPWTSDYHPSAMKHLCAMVRGKAIRPGRENGVDPLSAGLSGKTLRHQFEEALHFLVSPEVRLAVVESLPAIGATRGEDIRARLGDLLHLDSERPVTQFVSAVYRDDSPATAAAPVHVARRGHLA